MHALFNHFCEKLMLVDLALLLRDRQVCHPSRITAAVLKDRKLQVRIAGWPWWKDDADIGRDHGIKLIFRGVGEGVLELWDFDSENSRALERFSVIASDDLPWAQPNGSAIYCSTPLPKPLNIYLAVNDFLSSHGAFRRGEQYLNCLDNEELTAFVKITQTSSYLLGQFPPAIRDIVCTELDTQKAHYSELPCVFEKTGQLLVTIQRSQFFCETAEALFEI